VRWAARITADAHPGTVDDVEHEVAGVDVSSGSRDPDSPSGPGMVHDCSMHVVVVRSVATRPSAAVESLDSLSVGTGKHGAHLAAQAGAW
jgi:hypothetical protein